MAEELDWNKVSRTITISPLLNGFLVHTPWGRLAYPTPEELMKGLEPQFKKLQASAVHAWKVHHEEPKKGAEK